MKYALRTALPNKICSGTFVPEQFDFNGTPMQWPVTFLLTSSARVCPIALTMGEKDIVVPDYMVLDNYNAFKANATLLPYENCGHSPMVDCPDRLAADVLAFFA